MNFDLNAISKYDPEIAQTIAEEIERQQNSIELIASENIVSPAVLMACGSPLTNKYAEGYPGKRYYGGCEAVDKTEELAKSRLKKLFNSKYANVQPHSGSQANQAVFMAALRPGDRILSMSLSCGGHLTHGHPSNQSGKWFEIEHYGVQRDTHLINYEEVANIASRFKPQMIIAGASAYSRQLDFALFRKIADSVGAYLLADVAHYAGLIATKRYPTPLPHAHFVTSTTHKTLRGPRGGIIMTNDENLAKKIDSALFPGLQGGPLMHIIAAKAIAFAEALSPEFSKYIDKVLHGAKEMAARIQSHGYEIVSGGTDSHLMIINLSKKNIPGIIAEKVLDLVGITCNKNTVPYDTNSPVVTSGIRIGTPAIISRGFDMDAVVKVADLICEVLDFCQQFISANANFDKISEKEKNITDININQNINAIDKFWIENLLKLLKSDKNWQKLQKNILNEVQKLCHKFPIID